MLKKIILTIVLALLAGFTAAQEIQAKSCGIELNVTGSDSGQPIRAESATIMNLATKKAAQAGFFEGYPIFSNLREGSYKVTVNASGYKTTVRQINLNCRQADTDQNSVTIDISLQKGSRKEIYKQADSAKIKPPAVDITIATPAATPSKFKEI